MVTSVAMASYLYIRTPVAEMRERPEVQSPVVSQALFAEQIMEVDRSNGWVYVRTLVDDYPGWLPATAVCTRHTPFAAGTAVAFVNRLAAHLYQVPDTIYGPTLTLPYESRLEVLNPAPEKTGRWIQVITPDTQALFVQIGDVRFHPLPMSQEDMLTLSHFFLNLPYTWGGRSSFGYDCSGYVQMLYRQIGVALPRDAKDQILSPDLASVPLEDARACDLVFFGHNEAQIRHVGLCIGDDRFVHATVAENMPYIRVSRLSDREWIGQGKLPYRALRRLRSSI